MNQLAILNGPNIVIIHDIVLYVHLSGNLVDYKSFKIVTKNQKSKEAKLLNFALLYVYP